MQIQTSQLLNAGFQSGEPQNVSPSDSKSVLFQSILDRLTQETPENAKEKEEGESQSPDETSLTSDVPSDGGFDPEQELDGETPPENAAPETSEKERPDSNAAPWVESQPRAIFSGEERQRTGSAENARNIIAQPVQGQDLSQRSTDLPPREGGRARPKGEGRFSEVIFAMLAEQRIKTSGSPDSAIALPGNDTVQVRVGKAAVPSNLPGSLLNLTEEPQAERVPEPAVLHASTNLTPSKRAPGIPGDRIPGHDPVPVSLTGQAREGGRGSSMVTAASHIDVPVGPNVSVAGGDRVWVEKNGPDPRGQVSGKNEVRVFTKSVPESEKLVTPMKNAKPEVEEIGVPARSDRVEIRNMGSQTMAQVSQHPRADAATQMGGAEKTGAANGEQTVAFPDVSELWESRPDASERGVRLEPYAQMEVRPGASVANRVETYRTVIVQMQDALVKSNGRSVEIALNPEELGNVRIALSVTEAVIGVSIAADRPETLDLLRRHIDQLVSDFKELGYGAVDLEFSGSGENSAQTFLGANSDEETNTPPGEDRSAELNSDQKPQPLMKSGLDIRI